MFSPKLTWKLFPGVKMMLAIGYVFEYSFESALTANSPEMVGLADIINF